MNKAILFILLLLSQLVFAGNSVSCLGLNGPVKCYKVNSQVLYFDEAGYLTHADRCRPEDIRLSWKECYKHVLDESGNLIKTYIAKTEPPFVEEAMSDSVVYPPKPKNNSFIDDFYKNKIGKCRKESRLYDGVSANFYYKKGILDRIEYLDSEVPYVVKYYYKAKSDSLEKVKISFLGKRSIHSILDGKGNTMKYYEKNGDAICDDQYSYYDDGRVKQKTMYHRNYYVSWDISDIDCVITYIYDDWKNLVKEEWYHKDSKKTSVVEYEVEYY
jgi:hypothetical protein